MLSMRATSASGAELPPGLAQAFAAVVGELGQVTASWLFVRAVARCEGDAGVEALAESVGPSFTVLDAVAQGWLEGERELVVEPAPVVKAIGNATRLVVVGVDAAFLDALFAALDPKIAIALVTHTAFDVDWDRVLDNWGGRVERVDLDTFQQWAGGKSALLTFAFGRQGDQAAVAPLWLRACGADVRSQFRALIAWDILGRPLSLYPRWLVEVEAQSFTHFVR
jgi:hypothetical protein